MEFRANFIPKIVRKFRFDKDFNTNVEKLVEKKLECGLTSQGSMR